MQEPRGPETPDIDLSLRGLIRARKKRVDPFEDYRGDGTRMLAWVQTAVAMVADLTERTRQEVVRDALLGIQPLPDELLDTAFEEEYGYARPRR